MKRFARFGPMLALLAVVAITVITILTERSRATLYAWRPLPGGGELRLRAITHGLQHSVDLGGSTLRDRALAAWQARSMRPLIKRVNSTNSTHSGRPSLAFWLEVRNLPMSEPPFVDGELVLPDGQIYRMRGRFGSSSRSGGATLFSEIVMFPIIPARAKNLHFDVRINGAPFVFEAANPAYRTDLPVWKANPLPQTKRRGDVALTLRGVNVFHKVDDRTAGVRADWHAQPLWTIEHGKSPGDRFHHIAAVFEDPAGNASSYSGLFSEPVWKVRATITRTEHFPFADDEVRWIGTIDPAAPEASTPQAYALLPLVEDYSGGRLKLVGVFGPGKFEIKNRVVAAAELEREAHPEIESDRARGVCIVRLARPAVLILEDRFARRGALEMRIFRDEMGSAWRLKERASGSVNLLSLGVFDLPANPVRLGLAKSGSFQLEFFIRAPARPSTPPSNTSGR